MRRKVFSGLFSLSCFLFLVHGISNAQTCNCNRIDPFKITTACNAKTYIGINQTGYEGSVQVCGTTAACGPGYVTYSVNLTSTQLQHLTGYFWVIHGGGGKACYNGIASDSGGGPSHYGFTSDTQICAKINWISAGPNTLEFFGYTGWDGVPDTLYYYSCIQVSVVAANTKPPAPTNIFMSSAVCYPPPMKDGWMYESSPCSPIATSWTWTGAGSGTYFICDQGPVLTAGAWNNQAYLCVTQNNACGSSAPYCAYVTVPSSASPPCPKNNGMLPVAGQVMKASVDDPDGSANRKLPDFEMYPNPATDRFLISLPANSNYNIQVVSDLGQVVKNIMSQNTTSKAVTVSGLANGLYFVIIKENGIPVSQKKIIVQH